MGLLSARVMSAAYFAYCFLPDCIFKWGHAAKVDWLEDDCKYDTVGSAYWGESLLRDGRNKDVKTLSGG